MSPHALWEAYMRSYDYLASVESYARNLEDVARAAGAGAGREVLDAGSGTGNLSLILKARGASVTACDFSAEAIRQHRAKDPAARVLRLSLEEPLPFPAASFDAVCCASVLFALSRDGCGLALREFHRVLRPGGRLVVTVAAPAKRNRNLLWLHLRNLTRRLGLVRGVARAVFDLPELARILYYNRRLQRLPDWQGYHRFTEEELRGFILKAGFKGVELSRTYGGSFLLAVAVKGPEVPSRSPAEAARLETAVVV